ncbi:hypothetical protein EYF80_007953 [Liparis tanakae]|uniref:Uncharacterized protein n=1 Tax=Liparis tanakae TaxID=230148 RepID=A0A4Z2IW92_9TELE|nr:hypothetical protein EYF80_007953 [Liparis tanakae]
MKPRQTGNTVGESDELEQVCTPFTPFAPLARRLILHGLSGFTCFGKSEAEATPRFSPAHNRRASNLPFVLLDDFLQRSVELMLLLLEELLLLRSRR